MGVETFEGEFSVGDFSKDKSSIRWESPRENPRERENFKMGEVPTGKTFAKGNSPAWSHHKTHQITLALHVT